MMDIATETPADMFASASRLHAAGRLEETRAVLNRLLDAEPAHASGLNLLGITLGQQGDLAAGAALVERAIAAGGGDNAVFGRNLCELRRQGGDPFGALQAGRAAAALAPQDRVARLNLAMAEQDALELDAAQASAESVLAAEPDNGSAHFLLAQLALLRGDLAAGWREYTWRWRIPAAVAPKPEGDVPEWDGVRVDGALLLIGDQGFGDMIQFARYLPWAAGRCGALVVGGPRELRGLLSRLVPQARFVVDLGQAGTVAAYTHLSSLPGLAGTTLDSIPFAGGPYLQAEAGRVQRWGARLDQLAPRPSRRVGVVWAGRREHGADRQRSMKLAEFAPLLALGGTTLVSLQKDDPVGQVGGCFGPAPLVNLGPELADFDDTAAVLSHLDALVSVDTSCVHLAGALGVRALVLLPFRPDWRWLLERTDTPWYGSVRLARDRGPEAGARAETVARAAMEFLTTAT